VFKWINKQGVESDAGFVVQFTGRFTAEYREGSKRISIEVEDGFSGGPAINYERASFRKWDSPHGDLSAEEQERVLKNFKEALRFQGLTPCEF